MKIYNASERLQKGKYVYLLYTIEGRSEIVFRCVKCDSRPPIMGDMCRRGEEHFIPLGFIHADEMLATLWSQTDSDIETLKQIGKNQAIWYKPKE